MKNIIIEVSGIKWDADTEEELNGVDTTVKFAVPVDEYNKMNTDELDEFIADKISDISGFCHYGWDDYKVIFGKCLLCGGNLIEETESNLSDFVCEDCDCLQDRAGHIYSDVQFYLANYGTEKNIEIFQSLEKAKKESVDGVVYTAVLNHENVWYEENIGWNYEDNSSLFLTSPIQVI